MNKVISFFFSIVTLFFCSINTQAQSDSIISVVVTASLVNDSSYALKGQLIVEKGWHIYGNNPDGLNAPTFQFALETVKSAAAPNYSVQPSTQKDILFKEAVIFSTSFNIEQTIQIKGFQPDSLKGLVLVNVGKGDQFYPLELPFAAALAKGTKASGFQVLLPTSATTPDMDACGVAAHDTAASSGLAIFFLGFLGGLIALVTPCVFPMIPVTVSYFTKRSKTRKQGIKNGLLYGLSILLIYVLASVPFHIMGNVQPEIFNSISTNATLNIIFFIIFIFFSISFFGYFEISLPSGIANVADSRSSLGSLGGIFFMAITLAIVSFSCTGPILGTLLVGSLQGGAWALTQGMAGFGFALALPFSLFAIFPQWLQSLPKSGGWLDTVKKVLAFLELALAFKFLSNADLVQHWGLLKREVFLGIWALISVGLALYLFGKLRLPHDVKGAPIAIARKILGVIAICFAGYLVYGIAPKNAGSLKLLSGFPPPTHYSIFPTQINAHGLQANVTNDYTKALALAKAQNKPILIDFTGWACVNCRKMEENVWSDPQVADYIKENFVLLSLYVDDRALLPVDKRFTYTSKSGQLKDIVSEGDLWATFQAENFNQVTQPLYVVLSPNEKILSNPVGYTPDIQEYLNWLKCSFSKSK
ncbi:MAG: protein-disulfide reductase DsbD family protein [Sediminibacterium sp.]